MFRRMSAAVAVAAVLMTAGCAPEPSASPEPSTAGPSTAGPSTPGPSGSSSASASPASPSPSPTPDSEILRLVQAIGLEDFTFEGDADYIAQWGVGMRDGSEVRVYEFASEEDFLTYLDSVAPFGITPDDFVRQGLYAVAPTDRSQLEGIRAALQ